MDPRLMNITFLRRVEVPYFHEFCNYEDINDKNGSERLKFKD